MSAGPKMVNECLHKMWKLSVPLVVALGKLTILVLVTDTNVYNTANRQAQGCAVKKKSARNRI